ncbi:polyribonucleotide nucleotidyltransferase [Candidatus Peribacteria bacterium]|nr:polyribonucleotide nucleotidyltransferase [Candidatus Peribacteria bacterium]
MFDIRTHSLALGEQTLTFETGKMARLAQGAVHASYGETHLLTTIGIAPGREGADFFPLSVDFMGKFYATGRIKYSKVNKREGKLSDDEVLMSRMIDRPLRPMFPKSTRNEVQCIVTLLQSDGLHNPGALGINAASMAMLLSGLPLESAVGAVRVGMTDSGEFFLDPTYEQSEKGKLDLLVAGTADAILMVEAGADQVDSATMLRALQFAHGYIQQIVAFQQDFLAQHTVTPVELTLSKPTPEAKKAVESFVTKADFAALRGRTKFAIKDAIHALEERVLERFATEIDDPENPITKGDLLYYLDKGFAAAMRERIFTDGKRIDDRACDEVRPLHSEVHLLSRVHGTGLFTRGETQALTTVTIGGPGDKQYLDDAHRPEHHKQFFHHYNFPPYSVGEVGRLGPSKRREIGHGALGERGLTAVMPTKEDNFPYTVRTTTEILAGNGSTSMAAVCGQTLALMDAGVPIKAPISGVAMGLMMNSDGQYRILTDIQSFEDFDGDMDFKVVGTKNTITALQMDMKVKGLPMSVLEEAFQAAEKARAHILEHMLSVIPGPRKEMSPYAPRITSFYIKPEDIGAVIGKGGETIQGLCADYEVTIDIEDDGLVMITSTNGENARKAEAAIRQIVWEPEVGDLFMGATVKTILEFGAFVEYAPGKDAMLHISEIADERVENVRDYLHEGQKVNVKYKGHDPKGRMRLTMKGIPQG